MLQTKSVFAWHLIFEWQTEVGTRTVIMTPHSWLQKCSYKPSRFHTCLACRLSCRTKMVYIWSWNRWCRCNIWRKMHEVEILHEWECTPTAPIFPYKLYLWHMKEDNLHSGWVEVMVSVMITCWTGLCTIKFLFPFPLSCLFSFSLWSETTHIWWHIY